MTAERTPQQVADSLSEAQRVVLEQAATNDFVEMFQIEARRVHQNPLIACLKVMPSRHVGGQEIVRFRITLLGLAVRAILQKAQP